MNEIRWRDVKKPVDNAQTNIVWHNTMVSGEDRQKVIGHRPALLWLTGLSGSGKSTIATELQKKLLAEKKLTYILDGDNVRHGLNQDLTFSPEHRTENIRRIGEVGKLFVDAGLITITSFISPYKEDRNAVRSKIPDNFHEIFVKCNLEDCEQRDPKGLYKKARAGEIKQFTGIDAPYEEPENPELIVNTSEQSVQESVDTIYNFLAEKNII